MSLRDRAPTPPGPLGLLVGGILSLTLLATALACDGGRTRPNLILVSIDTVRADHLGLYGYERDTSPTLDAFASQSVVFERAIAQSASTTPSHRSLLQSRIASLADPEGLQLAEVLSAAGYQTAAFTGGGNIAGQLGFARGYDVYDEDPGGLASSLPKLAAWLSDRDRSPFHVFLHTYDAHLPYDPPPPHATLFDPDYQGPVTGAATRSLLRRERAGQSSELDAADRQKIVALYDGGVRYLDDQLGRLFEFLRHQGLYDDALIVVFSDHGEEFWDHGSVIHAHTLYQELLHVPLIIKLPGSRYAGRRIASPVGLVDLAPTLLDLAGVDPPPSFQGRSLRPVLDAGRGAERPITSEMLRLRSRIEYPWKLILGHEARPHLLYDLSRDPQERRSLHEQEPEIVTRMEAALTAELGEDGGEEVRVLDPGAADDANLQERLRALGYIE